MQTKETGLRVNNNQKYVVKTVISIVKLKVSSLNITILIDIHLEYSLTLIFLDFSKSNYQKKLWI